jgi:hypothetical protein
MLAAMLVILTADATAHAKMEMRTFPVLAGAGAHDGRSRDAPPKIGSNSRSLVETNRQIAP